MKKRLILFLTFMLVLLNICFLMPRAESVSGDASNSDEKDVITIEYFIDCKMCKSVMANKGETIELWIPEKEGYKFLYWKYSDENRVATIATNETIFTSDTALRAVWEILPDNNHPTNGLPMEYEYQTPQNIYTSIKKVKVRNNQLIVTVKKDKRAMSYTVKYSTSKKFSPKKTKEIRYKKNKITLKGLKKGETYYIQAVIKPRDTTKYRAYASKIKKVKIK